MKNKVHANRTAASTQAVQVGHSSKKLKELRQSELKVKHLRNLLLQALTPQNGQYLTKRSNFFFLMERSTGIELGTAHKTEVDKLGTEVSYTRRHGIKGHFVKRIISYFRKKTVGMPAL